jgi:hypothetical protein
MATTDPDALAALQSCRSALLTARLDALTAATRLAGVRRTRAKQFADMLADAVAHAEREAATESRRTGRREPGTTRCRTPRWSTSTPSATKQHGVVAEGRPSSRWVARR